MNRIIINDLVFDNEGNGNGKILDGSFYLENSLAEDELSIDTIDFRVRYPLSDVVDTSLTNLAYGTPCLYYQNNMLFGRYYLTKISRVAKYEYEFSFQSAIGLLDDSTHYGGIYQGELASAVIADIINEKIPYTCKEIFDKIKIYGWLPIASRRENLKQLLFAVGGSIKKNENGDVFISTLDTTAPIEIPDSRVLDTGKMDYEALINKVEVIEHGFIKNDTIERETIFEGEISGQNFITPNGYTVLNASLVQFDKPFHSIEVEGTTILNNEFNVNYCIIQASPNTKITGIPYIHTEAKVYKNKVNNTGEEKVATIKDATLISLANSASTAERILAYYGNSNTLSTSIVLNGEKPTNTISLSNPFGEKVSGFIKNLDGDFGNHIAKADVDVILNYIPPVVVGSRTLVSIAVTQEPTQTSYASGDYFNTAGMEVTAYYDDDTSNVLNSYFYSPMAPLKEEDTEIVITYTELGVTCSATVQIEVINLLRRIAITTPPNITAYYEQDLFDATGMVITAYYSNGNAVIVPEGEYSYSPNTELSKNDTTITITYTDTGITANAYLDITVGDAPNLVSIEIETPPSKTTYKLGEFFDTTGMVVRAYYDDNTNRPVKGYIYSPAGALTENDTTITITYTRNGIVANDTLAINIIYLTSIEITTPPTYTEYYEGNSFNKFGMVVQANYSDGSSVNLEETAYTVIPTVLVDSDEFVTISYSEQGIVKTATQPISVSYYPYDYTNSIVISESGTYTLADIGATHRNIRIIAIGGGTGGQGGANGEAGANTEQASISRGSSGSDMNEGAEGGAGGIGGEGALGGKIYSQDIVLSSADDEIIINIGSGGSGGEIGVNGVDGTDSDCTINEVSISSLNGTISETGYTDIFTNQTYAGKGLKGVDGGKGGKGASFGDSTSEAGEDVGNNVGGAGGTSSQNYVNSYSRTEYTETHTTSQSISEQSKQTQQSTFVTYNGYRNVSQNSDGTYSFTSSATIGKNSSGYIMTGTVYVPKRQHSLPNEGYNAIDTTVYIKYVVSNANTTNRTYDIEKQTITQTVRYTWTKHQANVTRGRAISGGSGASYGADGVAPSNPSSTSANSPAGANALSPAVAINFGYGGNGGNGGGGGGGAGGTGAEISNTSGNGNSYLQLSAAVSAGTGGAGGTGSNGGNGANGCVIIYYS